MRRGQIAAAEATDGVVGDLLAGRDRLGVACKLGAEEVGKRAGGGGRVTPEPGPSSSPSSSM